MLDILDVRAKAIIDELIDFNGSERAARLERECGSDRALRARVEALLAAMDKDDVFLRLPTVDAAFPPTELAASERPGERIGPYTLLRLIGEGGFGSVYLAEQSEPVRRQVALKIIKLGMDTRQVIARFEAERQALALMDHPNIARVFDAGATAAGRPFFVMERVQGEAITRFCDRERHSLRQRLGLFEDVCSAVQHAHQKGIIHRDIKPSNILVAEVDGRAVPKVIDFGIAKATAGRLTDASIFTEAHQMIGTPEYMSPEQADASATDIDTRSDVYSLGVLLYELLTGQSPFDRARLRSAPLVEVQRILREEEPQRPSLRLSGGPSTSRFERWPTPAAAVGASHSSDAGSSVFEIAQCRRTQPMTLTRAIRGDLDWIVLKCLEKDRSRRYETASALADDIRRYLGNQPVVARPPSAGYRLSKFVRRNRGAVFAVSAVAASLFVAVGVSLAFGLSEARQRAAAEQARDQLELVTDFQSEQLAGMDARAMGAQIRESLIEKARMAAERSKLSAAETDARVGDLEKLLAGSDFTGMALDVLGEQFFQPTIEAIEKQFADQPIVRAQLLQSMADTQLDVGLVDAATDPQTKALALRRAELGDDHPDTLASQAAMGLLLRAQGRTVEAEPYYHQALEARRRVLGEEHPDTLSSRHNLASLLQAQGKSAEAESIYREVLEKRRRILGEEHRDTLTTLSGLAHLLSVDWRLDEAEPYCREVLEKRRRVLGDEHPHTLFSMNNMAALLQTQGKLDEAQSLYVEALEKRRRILGDDHPDTLQSINNLGNLLEAQKKYAEAEPYYREALEKRRRILGSEHPHTLSSISNMGALLLNSGRPEEAEPFVREAIEQRRRLLGNDHQDTLTSINNMGSLLDEQGRYAEAEAYLREALEGWRRIGLSEHQGAFISIINLHSVLQAQGKHAEAVDVVASVEEIMRRRGAGGNEHRTGRFLILLGRTRTAAGQFEAAEKDLLEAIDILTAAAHASDAEKADAMTALAELYEAWHAADPSAGMDAKAERWRTSLEGRQSANSSAGTPSSEQPAAGTGD